jgi:hypothetical protein
MAISDQHSTDYGFSDLQIEVGGVRLDSYIYGSAELASDPGYTFYVKSITLPGSTLEPFPKPRRLSRDRIEAKLTLTKPSATDVSTNAVLFRLLEAAIYSDPAASEAWADETLMAAE